MSFFDDAFGDLFGEEEPSVIRHAKASKKDDLAREGWKAWCRATKRLADLEQPNREFIKTYYGLLELEADTHEQLLKVVELAAYLKPRNDKADVRRVIHALTSPRARTILASLDQEASEPYLHEASKVEVRSTVAIVVKATEVPRRFWTPADEDACAELIRRYEDEEIERLGDEVAKYLGRGEFSPSEFLTSLSSPRFRDKDKKSKKKSVRAPGSYEAGRTEEDLLDGIDFTADVQSQKLLVRGHDPRTIAEFHNKAPSGYWGEVLALISRGFDPQEAYKELKETFDWHPSSRKVQDS